MAGPFSTMMKILDIGFKIKSALDNAKHNMEECRKIDALLLSLCAITKHLQGSPKIMEHHLMRDTAKGLDKTLQLASDLVAKCMAKGFLDRALNAKHVAEKLRGVCLDVQLNMNAVLLANGVLNSLELAELKEIVAKLEVNMAQLCANVAWNSSELAELKEIVAKILRIVATQPAVHLQEEVERLVEDDQTSSQIKIKGKAKKTAAATSQDKTVVARPEVKIQKKKKLRHSTVVPDASLRDGLTEFASAASVVGQGSSTVIINKIISRSIENMNLVTSIDAHPTKP
ncbi:hypothetical protein ACQJBY_061606 [Aegilops geniculata]